MTKRDQDVIVVGAGPAGATLGSCLSESGWDVLVIDRRFFPRSKLCGGLLTWKTQTLLKKLFPDFEVETHPWSVVSKLYTVFEGRKEKVFRSSIEPFVLVDREEYDAAIVRLAQSKGCRFLFGERVTRVDTETLSVCTLSGKRFRSEVVVGADGAGSLVRRSLDSSIAQSKNRAVAFQIDIAAADLETGYREVHPKILFGSVRGGYGWIFPHKDRFVAGIWGAALQKYDWRKLCRVFFSLISGKETIPNPGFVSHLVPLGRPPRPGKGNVLLSGDAGGYTDPITGEGIYYAHKTAEQAACSIHEFLCSGGRTGLVQEYENRLRPIHRELEAARRLRRWAYSPLRKLGYLPPMSPLIFDYMIQVIHGLKKYSDFPSIKQHTPLE